MNEPILSALHNVVAIIQHRIWAQWMTSMISRAESNLDGSVTLSAAQVAHYAELAILPFAALQDGDQVLYYDQAAHSIRAIALEVDALQHSLAVTTADRDRYRAAHNVFTRLRNTDRPAYAIWWLSQEDCDALGLIECPDEEFYHDDGLKLPDYIRLQYRSRNGRPGRGRLWIAKDLPISKDWEIPAERFDPPIGQTLARYYGGIVIHAHHVHLVACLPGLVTDDKLDYWQL